jgi:hypothetical protein
VRPEPGPERIYCPTATMGGKNKKHKAPGAAAVRAAVSASRAKSAEAGAAGEAQSKKPLARPCPAAASARDPRVKQGTGVAQLQAIRREQKMFRSEHTRSKFVSPIAEAASSPWGGILLDQRKLFGPPHCHGSPAAARGLLFNSQFFSFQEQNNCISCNFNRDPS